MDCSSHVNINFGVFFPFSFSLHNLFFVYHSIHTAFCIPCDFLWRILFIFLILTSQRSRNFFPPSLLPPQSLQLFFFHTDHHNAYFFQILNSYLLPRQHNEERMTIRINRILPLSFGYIFGIKAQRLGIFSAAQSLMPILA